MIVAFGVTKIIINILCLSYSSKKPSKTYH